MWPWHRRRDLENRIQQLEQANIRILGLMESVLRVMDGSREVEEMQAELQALRGQLPVDCGDLPDYIW